MKRSTAQVLLRYLPGAVFQHEDGYFVEAHHIRGHRATDLNLQVLLEELADDLSQWRPDQVGIPDPSSNAEEFVVIQPEEVSWDVFPLTFECVDQECKRVVRWFNPQSLVAQTNATGTLRCPRCQSKVRQLRYVTVHYCGAMEPLRTPRCTNCQSFDNMYLDDLGSFGSSSWRCRPCGTAVGVRFTPCSCGEYGRPGNPPFQQGYATRDQHLWYPQSLTLINISGQTYDNLQKHPQRGVAALASWLGDEQRVSASLSELERPDGGARMSAEAWAEQEAKLREVGIDEVIIYDMRTRQGPAVSGVSAVMAEVTPEVLDAAGRRTMVERAGLFDTSIITDRKSVTELHAAASGAALTAATFALDTMRALGIEDVSVTQRFPIVIASYGFSRRQREPGSSHLRTYARQGYYDGKTPIFAVPAGTEALLVTLDARAVLGFLSHEGDYLESVPGDLRAAKLALAELLAQDPTYGSDGAAGKARRLVHSASHALLRALDDGQSGFGESSLAEWIVPDALTSAIYVASYNDFTLGAFDTVLRRRLAPWLLQAAENMTHCDNDPMCSQTSSQRPHAACDRCLHLSYGCRTWNADLDRRLLRRFWMWTQQHVDTP